MPRNIAVSFFENDEFSTTLALPRATSFEALRQRWREASSDSSAAFFRVRSLNGAALPEEGCLEDVISPQESVLAIHVLCAEEKNVRVLGTSADPVTVRLLPQETTEALTERLKDLVGIQEDRVARLLCGGRVLEADVPPSVQLAGCAFIDVDVELHVLACWVEPAAFHPVLRDKRGRPVLNKDLPTEARSGATRPADPMALAAFAKAGEVRALRLFASQRARELTGAGQRRAIAWGTGLTVAGDEALCGLATEAALLDGSVLGVVIERRMKIWIEEKLRRRSTAAFVWPSDKLDHLLTNTDDSLLIEGEPVASGLLFWEAGLQPGSCVCLTRRTSLSVFNGQGAVKKVNADLGESLLDFRQRLGLPECDFDLWCDGVQLPEDERCLADLNVDSTSILVALPKTRLVQLKLGRAEPVRVGAVPKTTTFHAFLQRASDALKRPLLPPKTRFVCTCGRVFSNENALRREFPLRCCSAAELRFAVEEPPKSKKNQTAFRHKEVSCEIVTESHIEDTQTVETRHEVETQTTTPVHEKAVQVGHTDLPLPAQPGDTTRETPVEEATATPRISKFRIAWAFDKRGYFDLEVPFQGAPRGRELRAAIAAAREVDVGNLRLLQCRAKRKADGGDVVMVGEGGFGDERGNRVMWDDIESKEWLDIRDEDNFPTARHLRTEISARKRVT